MLVFSKDNIPKSPVIFQTHDNCERPFQVLISEAGINIEHNVKDLYVPFKHYDWSDVCKVMVPKNYDTHDTYGNSMLIELVLGKDIEYKSSDNFYYDSSIPVNYKYVHYGCNAYSFLTDTPIKEYHSCIGNNDVPYPISVSDNKVYFMLDHCYVTDTEFSNHGVDIREQSWYDGYDIFYRFYTKDNRYTKLRIEPMNGLCILRNRMDYWSLDSVVVNSCVYVDKIKNKVNKRKDDK
jgi:hypothetical protein